MDDMWGLVQQVRDLGVADREIAAVVVLDGARVRQLRPVGHRHVDHVVLSPLQVLRPVVLSGHARFLLVHTHLEDRAPSEQDLAFTRRLVAAAVVVGSSLTGHLVVGPTRWWDCLQEAMRSTVADEDATS